jgi:hypothetical protein
MSRSSTLAIPHLCDGVLVSHELRDEFGNDRDDMRRVARRRKQIAAENKTPYS